MVNPTGPAATNGTKPWQVRYASDFGFDVPASLLTNDWDAARAFADHWNAVIYKAVGGTRTLAGLLDVGETDRLGTLASCPVHRQEYVRGVNVRVHVVADRWWACEIPGEHVDWRRSASATLRRTTLPPDLAERCVRLTRDLGLHLAGIDLIRADDGRWVFLEANTAPAFTAFLNAPDIANAVADLLLGVR